RSLVARGLVPVITADVDFGVVVGCGVTTGFLLVCDEPDFFLLLAIGQRLLMNGNKNTVQSCLCYIPIEFT
ncbi:MAG TPA: hypothetical protein PLZ51_04900, partial [Aggregatilineales bacterium]|nr:hypothetical protein [Aggregatilineales bacterium]